MRKLMLPIRLLRMYQWTKNLLVFAALIFAKQAFEPGQAWISLKAFIAFCLAASGTYLINDIMDLERDRAHPRKKYRPLPSGEVSVTAGIVISVLLFAGAIALSWSISGIFFIALLVYILLTLSYSMLLKDVIIIDVMALAMGFVVRAMAGAVALNVEFSKWLVVCTLFLALFLALSKRRGELTLLEEGAHTHRRVLFHYSIHYLDQLILIMAGGALITYTIYTCSPEVVQNFGTDKFYMTIPFVVYGLFRYLFLLHRGTGGEDPSRTLLTDIPLALNVLAWGIACILIVYWL